MDAARWDFRPIAAFFPILFINLHLMALFICLSITGQNFIDADHELSTRECSMACLFFRLGVKVLLRRKVWVIQWFLEKSAEEIRRKMRVKRKIFCVIVYRVRVFVESYGLSEYVQIDTKVRCVSTLRK